MITSVLPLKVDGTNHACVCLIGWQGQDCSQCRPYWQCPNQDPSLTNSTGSDRVPACLQPNQCFCDVPTANADTTGSCNFVELNNQNSTSGSFQRK